MVFETLGFGLLFFAIIVGLGCPVALKLAYAPAERILAAILISLLALWSVAWAIYVAGWSRRLFWMLPIAALLNLALQRRRLAELARDPGARSLIAAQVLVSGWSVGWLALIQSYSGGDWVGDWFGHWDRTRFFIERWPRDFLFTGFDPLPSRPPLVNVVTGTLLKITRVDFAHYQLAMSLLNSLAFLPAALLAGRFVGKTGADVARSCVVPLLAVLFMLNPLFVENATYAWTKLITAFFVLSGLYFFLAGHDDVAPRSSAMLCASALAAALLAHYSAAPYVLVLGSAWLLGGGPRGTDRAWRHHGMAAATVGAVIVATWFGWAIAEFGFARTFLSNTSVTDQAATIGQQLTRVALNLRDTLVPHPFRDPDFSAFTQRSALGAWRDWWFLLYQRNIFAAVGCVSGLVVLILARRQSRTADAATRRFWLIFIATTFVLGVAAHAGRDPWGNTHICEQPLVLLALAFLAAHWRGLEPRWRRWCAAGLAVDFTCGIALQFTAQSGLYAPSRSGIAAEAFANYSQFALMNLRAKFQLEVQFFSEALRAPPWLMLALLAALFSLALLRLRAACTARVELSSTVRPA